MASGKNYDRAIIITTPVILATAIASGHAEIGLIATASYYLAGMYLSPDLDLVSRPFKRWGFSGGFGSLISVLSPAIATGFLTGP